MFILPEDLDVRAEGITMDMADVVFPDIDVSRIDRWLNQILASHDKRLGSVQYIFCSDAYLQNINQEHLDHTELTDIITFEYQADPVQAEIYISTERVLENSQIFGISYETELLRVIAHGVLHLCGYKDKQEEDMLIMRQKEDFYLNLYDKSI